MSMSTPYRIDAQLAISLQHVLKIFILSSRTKSDVPIGLNYIQKMLDKLKKQITLSLPQHVPCIHLHVKQLRFMWFILQTAIFGLIHFNTIMYPVSPYSFGEMLKLDALLQGQILNLYHLHHNDQFANVCYLIVRKTCDVIDDHIDALKSTCPE